MSRNLATAFIGSIALMSGLLSMEAHAQDFSLSSRQADFKSFVHDFEDSYVYLDRPEKPWLTWEARYSADIDKADSKEAFDTVLASALSELHDFHAEVRSRVPNRWLPSPTFTDIWAEFQNGHAIVTAVRQGSDAERAGIRVGNQITAVGSTPLQTAISNRLTPAVDQEDARGRQWALLSVLTGRSDEARIFTVVGIDGSARTITLPVKRQFNSPEGSLTTKTLPGNVGLIRFNNSLGEQKTVAAFDAALEELRSTKGLILDLRDVPSGGDSSVALGIMGRFVTRLLPYQRHRIPNYGQSDVERNWIELVAPRGPFTYSAPVVVLVNHWTGSMGEGMAIGFDAMQRGRVVGTPMAHLAGAVSDDKLPRTGVDVAFATEQLFHVNGTPRQDWLPPILVVGTPHSRNSDPILAKSLAELGKKSKWSPAELMDISPIRER
jgi:C-terminal processing protease CtpA/Prc